VRIFHGRLVFDKYTERKYRWVKDVDGVKFKVYIQEERVPQPCPKVIEVSIFKDKELYSNFLCRVGASTIGELTSFDREDLAAFGLDETKMKVAGHTAILGAVEKPDPDHSETVRYNAYRHDPALEFGDPYIPKSVLGDPYPDRLLFLVRWID
jgi:hypothetical protein